MALKLCPQAKVIKGDMERYSIVTYGDRSNSRKNRLLPKIDEFYLDITGMDRFMVVTNGRMNSHKVVKETGLPISLRCRLTKQFLKLVLEKNLKDI
jgi:DNA polymerase-4